MAPRRLFPDLLGQEYGIGGTHWNDLLGVGDIRMSELPGPDGKSQADGQPPDPTGLRNPDPSFYDDAGAYGGQTVAELRMGGSALGGVGQPFRTRPPGGDIGRNPIATAQTTAGTTPTGQYEGGPGSSGTLGRTANGTHPQDRAGRRGISLANGQPTQPEMQQPARAPPPQPGMPQLSGTPNKKSWLMSSPWGSDEGGLLGNDSMKPTRLGLLGEMMLGASEGMAGSRDGNWIGGGIRGAGRAMIGAKQNEQERRQQLQAQEFQRLQMQVQMQKLMKGDKQTPFGSGETGYYTLGDDGKPQQLVPGVGRAEKTPGSIEAALMSPDPEVRGRAEQLWREKQGDKGAITPYQQEMLKRRDQELALQRERANRQPGQAAAARPSQLGQLYREMNALPPDSPARAEYQRAIKNFAARSGPASVGGGGGAEVPQGFVAPTTATVNDTQKKIVDFQTTLGRVESFDKSFDPDLQTKGESWGATVETLKEKIGLEGDPAKRAQLAALTDQKARIGEIASEYRHALFGAGLTGPELESAMQWMPDPNDSATVLKSKVTNVKRVLRDKIRPLQNVLTKGIDVRPPAEDVPAAPPPPPPQDVIRSPIQGPAITDMPQPEPGMKMADYARLLHRNGLSVEQAKEAARRAFEGAQ